jgi:hypothetical protein
MRFGKRVLTLTESATLNLVVVVGAMLGGFIAVHFMGDPQMLL